MPPRSAWIGRPPVGLALVLAALLLGGSPARAQEEQIDACRPPVLSVQPVPPAFDPGDSYQLLFAIENPNGPPVEAVRATVTTTTPAGWTAVAAQREMTLGPRNVTVDVLAITAPNRGTGQPAGNITILVTFVCASRGLQTSASTSATVEVQISEFSAPWPLVLGGFVLLAGGVTVLGLRRLRRGVALVVASPERSIEAGKSAKFTFVIENRRGKPQRFRLRADGVPEGWSIHLALEDIELEPGEEKAMWAILRAPPQAPVGAEADVALRLESPEHPGAAARIRARVISP